MKIHKTIVTETQPTIENQTNNTQNQQHDDYNQHIPFNNNLKY